MSENIWRQIKKWNEDVSDSETILLKGFNGVTSQGKATQLNVFINNEAIMETFYVIKEKNVVILGIPWRINVKGSINYDQVIPNITYRGKENKTLNSQVNIAKEARINNIKKIDTGNLEIDELLGKYPEMDGVIQESSSDISSPILMVKKKTGEYQMCIDYRRLNAQT